MEDVKSSDLLIICEKAYDSIGWNYARTFESTCYYAGVNVESLNVYDEMKKIYESQHDSIHKIVITNNPISIQCILESIKSRTAYVILPRPDDVLSELMILQDMYVLFDYIAERVSSNFVNYKKSFCKKCKSARTIKLKIINDAVEYTLVTNFVYFLNSKFKYTKHECTT